ncbi:MAG: hypothetical protein PHR45_02675, partial [Muribaculaceae bacterium]|nr:hypothetical protein [Muribaculaceae bacterium]
IMDKVTVDKNVVKVNTTGLEIYTFLKVSLVVKDERGVYVSFGDVPDYVTAMYVVVPPADKFICASATPAEGTVTSLKDITLTFTNADDPRDLIGGIDKTKEVVLKNAAGETVAKGTFGELTFDTPLSVVVTLSSEVTAAGVYTLVLPAATVYNGMFDEFADDFGVSYGAIYNPEKTFTYTITGTGVESILGDVTGDVNVYTISGILIRTADASVALDNLEPGIYIVNGKKIVIKY